MAIVVDGIPDELYSLELTPGSFIEPASGVGIEIKSTSKAGFVVKDTGVSIPSDVPRVVAIVTGAECPALQDAVTLAAKQRGSRRESAFAGDLTPVACIYCVLSPEDTTHRKSKLVL